MIQFSCPHCERVLKAKEEYAGKQVQCPGCTKISHVPEGGTALAPITTTTPSPPPLPSTELQRRSNEWTADDRPRRRREPAYDDDDDDDDRPRRRRYRDEEDNDDLIRRPRGGHTLTTFPVWAMVILHFLTLGIFTTIRLNLMHGQMPQNRPDDPSAGKAIGFLFIPFFNLYWVFFTYTRLCLRINEQRRLVGLRNDLPTGLAIAMCILMIIPYIGLFCFLLLAPIFSAITQLKVNELCLATADNRSRRDDW